MRGFIRLTLGTACSAALACGAGIATAQVATPVIAPFSGSLVMLDTITLTASGEPVAVSSTGAAVSVLTDEDIARAGTLSFGNLLARQPGVSFSSDGGPGTSSNIRVRGLGSAYVGARLDGFDVTDTAGTQLSFNFNTLGTGGLSRIEVLRGSQSALYGSEAIAGVIDITTFRPTGDGFTGMARIETGTASTHTAEIGVGFLDEKVELAFSASRTVSDGGFSARAGGVEDDGYDITTAAAYAAMQVSDALRLGANLLWRESYGEFDSTVVFEQGVYSLAYQRGARVFAELETGDIHHELAFTHLTNDRVSVEVNSSGSSVFDFDGGRDSLTYYGSWRAGEALGVNWGYVDTRESFVTRSPFGDNTGNARAQAIHAEALWSPNDALDLSFALRHDEHEMFGGKATGRVAAAWRPADGWTLRAVAGTGFRAPSLYELFDVENGNPDLAPEVSRSIEFGIEHEFASGATIQLTAFDMNVRDKIDFVVLDPDPDNFSGRYEQISGETVSRGIEFSGRTEIASGWSLFGNYTYTDARVNDGTSVTRASRVPRHSLTLGVEGDLTERLSTALSVHHSGDNYEVSSYGYTGPLPDYTLVNTSFTYALDQQTEATFRVENLFDQDYQTVHGYNQPGRQVFVGVRRSF